MNHNRKAVIVAALRTAIGSFLGSLKSFSATELGAIVIRELIERTKLGPAIADEVIMGQIYTAGAGPNPARQAALKAGLPVETVATTINMLCGSGLRSIAWGAQAIQCGAANCVIAGGMESMSQAPFVLPGMRQGVKMGHGKVLDTMLNDGLWDPFYDCHMAQTAETLAEQYAISREEQDRYAAQSQQRCAAAQSSHGFASEIVPVSIPQHKKEPILFKRDEHPRPGVTVESIRDLKPIFKSDGTVTAANASGINDGAAAVVLMRADKARELEIVPMAYVKGFAQVGVDPGIMGIGPAGAIRGVLQSAQLSLKDMDLLEVNEAFAAQILAVGKELQWDESKVNVNGGAIAMGHPLGASGARITVTLLHEMQRREVKRGLASLCIGGGMGIAMILERE